MQFELKKEFLETLENAIEAKDATFVLNELADLYAADINSVLYELNTGEAKYIIDLLDIEITAEIIGDLESDIRVKFLKHFSPKELALIISHVDSDDAADILNEFTLEVRDEIISKIEDQETASNVLELIHYEEGTAGALMAKEFICADHNWSVTQCIEEIRRQAEKVEKIYTVYVVDGKNRLLGRVSVKKLLLASDEMRVSDIYSDDVLSINAYESEEEVAHKMSKYDLDAIPVVNIKNKLLGRITIDDVVDVITEQAEADIQLMSGISNPSSEYSETVWTSLWSRLPWLLIGMLGGLLGANLIGLFEDDLIRVPAMAFFIPLITATGGNVGIQSSSVVVQSLAKSNVFDDDWWVKLLKSFFVALMNGLAISIIVFGFNLFFYHDVRLAMVISIALYSVVVLASMSGTITPIILDKFGINPAMASGPFITTTNDILGIAVYFTVARILL